MSREEVTHILKDLITEQYTLVENIREQEGGIKGMVTRIAQIMEQRIELLDPSMTIVVSQISTEITRILRDNNCASADNVNHYLPEKYKNQNMARFNKLTQSITDSSTEYCNNVEDCSNSDLESMLVSSKNAKNNADKLLTNLNNNIENIRAEFLRRGITQVGDEKYRAPISMSDCKHMVPDDEELQRINEGVVYWIRQTAKAMNDIADLYEDYPATTVEHATQYFNANKMLCLLYQSVKDVKWSGDLTFWFDRNYWAKAQSAHDSGNSTKFDSILCAYCSRDIANDPMDFHVMVYDKFSPSGYRCDNCNGTAVLDRETTREQVTDRKPEIERMARDVVNHLPYYPEFFSHFRLTYIRDKIMARKLRISEQFSQSAIGGAEKIVVHPAGKNK